jgi:hypothetical protein
VNSEPVRVNSGPERVNSGPERRSPARATKGGRPPIGVSQSGLDPQLYGQPTRDRSAN